MEYVYTAVVIAIGTAATYLHVKAHMMMGG